MRNLVAQIAAAIVIVPFAQSALVGESDREKLVGTYKLVTTELTDDSGKWVPTPNFNSTGYITYSEAGYMGVHIMPGNRQRFAANPPTPAEAQQAIRGYTAYYGPFTVNERDRFVVHHAAGQINPGGPKERKRFYDFVGNRLVLTPAPADGGGKDQARTRLVWERQPNVRLSEQAKRFVGFRRLLYTDRQTEKDGRVAHGEKNETRAGSYIIYTPTGHMMVHLMNKEGRVPYAAQAPTPEEALAAFRSFSGYFGRFEVHETERPPYVIHHQEGTLNPGRESEAKRSYVFDRNVLRLGTPPSTTDGTSASTHLYWEPLPPLK